MGKTRGVYFDFNDDDGDFVFDFGTYTLMLYYAKQLNYEKAKLLYDATLSERYYSTIYNKCFGDLTDDDYCHFNKDEIVQVIDFIENDLVPKLENEEQDLIEKYGGREGFYDRFNKDKGFIRNSIYENEYYESDPLDLAAMVDGFKILLSHSLFINQAYRVDIR